MKERVIREGEKVTQADDQLLILIEEETKFLLQPDNTWAVVFDRFPDEALDFEGIPEKLPPDEVFGPDDIFNVVEDVQFIVPIKLQAKKAGAEGIVVLRLQIEKDGGGVVQGESLLLQFRVVARGSLNQLRG